MKIGKILGVLVALIFLSVGCDNSGGRSSSSGKLDSSFGTNGTYLYFAVPGGNIKNQATSVTTDSQGRVVVVGGGVDPVSGKPQMMIWRLTSSGSLDTSFNGSGVVVAGNSAGGNGSDVGYSAATDSADRVLVAGASVAGNGHFAAALWRYTPEGAPDTTFDGTGVVTGSNAANGSLTDQASGIALDATGKILVTGYSSAGPAEVRGVVWRRNPDGTPDLSFNGKGHVVSTDPAGGAEEKGSCLAVEPNGKVVATGFATNALRQPLMILRRFNVDGTPDTSFNTTGYVTSDGIGAGTRSTKGLGVALDKSHRIVVAGFGGEGDGRSLLVWRYNENGTPDTSFAGEGLVAVQGSNGGNQDGGLSVVIDAAGRIVVAGGALAAGNSNVASALWRFLGDGSLDKSFNGNGMALQSVSADLPKEIAHSVALGAAGKILVAGVAAGASDSGMFVSRFLP